MPKDIRNKLFKISCIGRRDEYTNCHCNTDYDILTITIIKPNNPYLVAYKVQGLINFFNLLSVYVHFVTVIHKLTSLLSILSYSKFRC